ncbi:MAG: hypothetical protein IJM62_03620 [Lachnospiraceae bacterium]|nr:hypothetical protein [Lachnospiraceae bacterium]
MDALILSCGTGGGHDAAARAIAEELKRQGHYVVIMNPYTLKSSGLAEKIDNTYINVAVKTPKLFGFIYNLGELYQKLPFRSPVYHINKVMVPFMKEFLSNNRFDVIITTHIFPGEILANMKKKGMRVPPTIHVATDYACIPFTHETDSDAYVVPSEDRIDEFARTGIPREKILPLGIPVDSSFYVDETRAEARKRLGLDPDRKYILIMGGSIGAGGIKAVTKKLRARVRVMKNTELIIICGNNKKLYKKIKALKDPHIRLIGYTENMAGYMRAADLFITKPGGLSSTEAAVTGVPMVHMDPIPGCETINAEFFSKTGMSRSVGSSGPAMDRAVDDLSDRRTGETMVRRQQMMISSDAAEKICSLAERMAGRKRSKRRAAGRDA